MTAIAYQRAEEKLAESQAASPGLDLSPVTGGWLNCDKGSSGGVLRMTLSERDGELVLRVWGAGGDAEPHDWGEVVVQPYAESVAGDATWSYVAQFDFGFMETKLFAYTKTGILVHTSYSTFKDGSGRANYWAREFFFREDA